jgi:hypothetical protein
VSNLPFSLLDDLWPGGQVMRLPVGGVIILVGIIIALWLLGCQLASDPDSAIGAFQRIGKDKLSPQEAQDRHAFRAGVARQCQGDRDVQRSAKGGIGDAHIPRSGIEQALACRQ